MDLSSLEGESFNDAIHGDALDYVHMATAKSFSYSVVDCGKNCVMWKWDMVDAYKNIHTALPDLRLQGFSWLGCYFVERQQEFGSSYSVSGFDRLGNTIAVLSSHLSGFPINRIHRTLDDLPIVDTENSQGHLVCAIYTALHARLGVGLAPPCPCQETAFEASTEGTVLGIRFHTSTLTWSLPEHKMKKLVLACSEVLAGIMLTVKDMQKLMGLLNNFCHMCPFLKGFRFSLNRFLSDLLEVEPESRPLPPKAASDLQVWTQAAMSATNGLPIPHRQPFSSLAALTFVLDAAGARFAKVNGRFIPYREQNDRGAASISIPEDGLIWFCARVTWPSYLLLARDFANHAYSCKSTTLEAVPMALPFLCCPEKLVGKEVLLLTDCEAVVYGWDARKVVNDRLASIILRSVHIIAAFLGCWVTIRHLLRISTPSAKLADRLT